MLYRSQKILLFSLIVLASILGLAGCSSNLAQQVKQSFPSVVGPQSTPTAFLPVAPTQTPTITPTATQEPFKGVSVWLDPALPSTLISSLRLPQIWKVVPSEKQANLQIGATRGSADLQSTWVYALVAPFPTLVDDISQDEIQRAWRGEAGQSFTGTLLLTTSTQAALQTRWGPANSARVSVLPENQLLDKAWQAHTNGTIAWAIIPFDAIEPRWKVLHIDGKSLFDRNLNIKEYPLTVWFGIAGEAEALTQFNEHLKTSQIVFPLTNRDPEKMTTLVMTGTTALTRATGSKMDTISTTYPARDIQDWLRNADLTHISNEVSFNPACPLADPNSTSMMFCSRPNYIELLDFIGTDIVELSGNHNNDWGRDAFTYSLDLYKQRGWTVFAGGANAEEARKPAKIENHGNKLAFIGCNPVGPNFAWATRDEPGTADCGDYKWLLDEIRSLRSEGYLPIVTFQYYEIYALYPSDHQQRHFEEAADAGAVIIHGSQAHFPQDMEFYKDSFVHFGLGNLFFDQMDIPVVGTRREFIDQHVFYNGKYINTELMTAMLEDYARPRPMTPEERQNFLAEVFKVAGW